jgi:hypothetical protein
MPVNDVDACACVRRGGCRDVAGLLLVVTAVFDLAYAAPLSLPCSSHVWSYAWAAWIAMTLSYLPTLRYYRMLWPWSLSLPLGAALYLCMSRSSAIRYWRGTRSQWKGRTHSH